MPKITGQFAAGDQLPARDYVEGDAGGPGLNQLLANSNEAVDYLDFFVGSTLDEPEVAMASDGDDITLSLSKAGGGDLRYRATGETRSLDCTPVCSVILTPGVDSAPVTNYVYIDHPTELLTVNTTGFPATPHSPLGEYYARSAVFHQTNGLLGKNHKNHVFTVGDNGHMGHINSARRKQPCVFENGLLLTSTGTGTATVNFALSSGRLYRMHPHDVSGISSPADFFTSNDETAADTVEANLNDVITYSDGASNLNEYCIYILFIAHLGTTTGLFLLKPREGYNTESEANTDPDETANWNIPSPYIGASIYVARVVARRTSSATTVLEINTDVRGLNPGSVAGGGLSGVPDHGVSHLSSDPIPASAAGILGATAAGSVENLTPAEARSVLDFETSVSNNPDVASNTSHRTSTGADHTYIDQSVVSGATPTLTGANITGVVHNTNASIQGGTTAEYYHQTLAEHTISTQPATTTVSGYLSTADWDVFDGKQDALTFDTVPTDSSTNPVESNGVKDALDLKVDLTGSQTINGDIIIQGTTADGTKYAKILKNSLGDVIAAFRNDKKIGFGTDEPFTPMHVNPESESSSGLLAEQSMSIHQVVDSTAGDQFGIAFGQSQLEEVYGGRLVFETTGSYSQGGFKVYTKNTTGPGNEIPNNMAAHFRDDGATGFRMEDPTASVHAKGITNDSSAYAGKFENSDGTNIISTRNDGQFYHDGGLVSEHLEITSDATLTNSSVKRVIVLNPAATGLVVTGPVSPESWETVFYNISAFDVTFARNGKEIDGVAANLTIIAGAVEHIKYFDSTTQYRTR